MNGRIHVTAPTKQMKQFFMGAYFTHNWIENFHFLFILRASVLKRWRRKNTKSETADATEQKRAFLPFDLFIQTNLHTHSKVKLNLRILFIICFHSDLRVSHVRACMNIFWHVCWCGFVYGVKMKIERKSRKTLIMSVLVRSIFSCYINLVMDKV